MSAEQRVERVLDAAYQCLVRHGIRKTTMDDIAIAAGMSRPAVYQYVRGKQDAVCRLAARLLGDALDQARAEAGAPGTLAQRMDRILAVELDLAGRLAQDGPYAAELISASGLRPRFLAELSDLLTATITDAAAGADLILADANAREIAELALALARGLAADPSSPSRPRERLRNGIALLVAGLAAAAKHGAADR